MKVKGLRLNGLLAAMTEVFMAAKKVPVKWGMVAKEKGELLQPQKADPAKKRARKGIEASKRRNRG